MADSIRVLSIGHVERADLAIIIVSWNVKDFVLRNLDSIKRSRGSIGIEIILVDNDSHDGTVEVVTQAHPDVRVIANHVNSGFALANEQGLLVKYSRHALLLNPDVCVQADTLQLLVDYLDTHQDVGVVGARLIDENGKIGKHVRRFPDVWSQLAIMLKLPHCFPGLLNHYLYDDFDVAKEQMVDSVRGSFFGIHERALAMAGGLDTRYFLWFEEVDYCKKMHQCGLSVMYVPDIIAIDFVGRSFAQQTTYWKQKLFTRSMWQYFQKWHPGWRSVLIGSVRPIALIIIWITDHLFKIRSRARL